MSVPQTSERMPSASALTAALLAPYAVRVPGMPRTEATDEMSTRCPEPWARKTPIAASHCACAPSTLVRRTARLAHALPDPMEAPLPMPALTMNRSSPPSRATSSGTTVATDSGSSTSIAAVSTRMPGWASRSSFFSASSRSVRRAASARSRPMAANRRAMPSPRPELAPVIRMRWRSGCGTGRSCRNTIPGAVMAIKAPGRSAAGGQLESVGRHGLHVGARGAGALELPEVGQVGEQDGAVERLAGVLTGRHLADDRAEERDAVDEHDRRADVLTDRVHARVVALFEGLVVLGRLGGPGELRRQADALQRGSDDLVELELLVVAQRAHRGVEVAEDLVAELLGGGDRHPDRADRLLHHLGVLLGQVPPAVEDGERHDVPVQVDVAHLRRLEHPAAGQPGPRTQRVEPEVDAGGRGGALHCLGH